MSTASDHSADATFEELFSVSASQSTEERKDDGDHRNGDDDDNHKA